jgi:WD40 repeat protein
VRSVAFAPNGRTLATGSTDHYVILWDLSDLTRPRLVQPLHGYLKSIFSVAFAPDGRTLATGSADHTVRLWDLSDLARPRQLGQPLTGHRNAVGSAAFAPDGRTFATGSQDHTVLLWDLSELDELRRNSAQNACALAGRGFDPDEWARYIPALPYQISCPS